MHWAIILLLTAASVVSVHMQVVYVCTILHTFMPPWEVLNDFPNAQKYYKVAVYVIGYGAGSARSTVYKSISTQSGTVVSPAVLKTLGTHMPKG
jgi:hypothetical protein